MTSLAVYSTSCVTSAFGRGSCPAFVRQAQRGVSCGVEVPTGEGLTNHPYRVWHLERRQQRRTNQGKRTQGTTETAGETARLKA